MKLTHAAAAVLAAVVTGVGGGAAAAQVANGHDQRGAQSPPATTKPSTTPTSTAHTSTTQAPKTHRPTAKTPRDALSEENLIRERLYYDVTGHSFTRVDPDPAQLLGPCTGDQTFADVLPSRGVTRIGSQLVGEAGSGLHVTEQLAQTRTAREARATAEEIVSLVDECEAIEGGDFGYGAPVTVQLESDREVVYFPAYSSDAAAGGYIVFSVGTRVGVVDVNDQVSTAQVDHLAKEAANIAGD
jgi:hypothetical protein